MFCGECGSRYEDQNARFCAECGTPREMEEETTQVVPVVVPAMTPSLAPIGSDRDLLNAQCTNCAYKFDDPDEMFCPECGTRKVIMQPSTQSTVPIVKKVSFAAEPRVSFDAGDDDLFGAPPTSSPAPMQSALIRPTPEINTYQTSNFGYTGSNDTDTTSSGVTPAPVTSSSSTKSFTTSFPGASLATAQMAGLSCTC